MSKPPFEKWSRGNLAVGRREDARLLSSTPSGPALTTLLTAAAPVGLPVRTIALHGTLDRASVESVRVEVTDALADGPVVVDLHDVSVCGIAGLRALMACHRAALQTRSPLV